MSSISAESDDEFSAPVSPTGAIGGGARTTTPTRHQTPVRGDDAIPTRRAETPWPPDDEETSATPEREEKEDSPPERRTRLDEEGRASPSPKKGPRRQYPHKTRQPSPAQTGTPRERRGDGRGRATEAQDTQPAAAPTTANTPTPEPTTPGAKRTTNATTPEKRPATPGTPTTHQKNTPTTTEGKTTAHRPDRTHGLVDDRSPPERVLVGEKSVHPSPNRGAKRTHPHKRRGPSPGDATTPAVASPGQTTAPTGTPTPAERAPATPHSAPEAARTQTPEQQEPRATQTPTPASTPTPGATATPDAPRQKNATATGPEGTHAAGGEGGERTPPAEEPSGKPKWRGPTDDETIAMALENDEAAARENLCFHICGSALASLVDTLPRDLDIESLKEDAVYHKLRPSGPNAPQPQRDICETLAAKHFRLATIDCTSAATHAKPHFASGRFVARAAAVGMPTVMPIFVDAQDPYADCVSAFFVAGASFSGAITAHGATSGHYKITKNPAEAIYGVYQATSRAEAEETTAPQHEPETTPAAPNPSPRNPAKTSAKAARTTPAKQKTRRATLGTATTATPNQYTSPREPNTHEFEWSPPPAQSFGEHQTPYTNACEDSVDQEPQNTHNPHNEETESPFEQHQTHGGWRDGNSARAHKPETEAPQQPEPASATPCPTRPARTRPHTGARAAKATPPKQNTRRVTRGETTTATPSQHTHPGQANAHEFGWSPPPPLSFDEDQPHGNETDSGTSPQPQSTNNPHNEDADTPTGQNDTQGGDRGKQNANAQDTAPQREETAAPQQQRPQPPQHRGAPSKADTCAHPGAQTTTQRTRHQQMPDPGPTQATQTNEEQHDTTQTATPHAPPTHASCLGDFDGYEFSPSINANVTRLIFFDGGAQPTPDRRSFVTAAAGVVVYEKHGDKWSKTFAQGRLLPSGVSAQVAEHTGMLASIKLAHKHRATHITAICGDNLNALMQVQRFHEVKHHALVKLCGRSIAMAQNLGDLVSFHHFTRVQHNPADTICNEVMDHRGDYLDRIKIRPYGGFADTDDTSDEPAFRKTLTIPRLYRHAGTATTNKPGEAATTAQAPLAHLTPEEVLCTLPTFWRVDDKSLGLLAQATTRTLANVNSTDPLLRVDAWRRFFLLPQSKLAKDTDTGKFTRLKDKLSDSSLPTAVSNDKTKQKDKQFETRKANRATALASVGLLGKAARVLERTNMPLPENVGELLQQLHPRCADHLPTADVELAIIAIDPDKLLAVMKEQSSLKSPGPSSWTEDLIFQACSYSEECLALAAAMVKDIANNNVPHEVADIVRACRLIALPKTETSVRPIAIGESIVKIAEAYVMKIGGSDAIESLRPEQSAFDKGGCEKIVHTLRERIEAGMAVVNLDMRNAFNTVSRKKILEVVRGFPILAPIVQFLYGTPSTLLHKDGMIMSEEGTRQGGVMSSLLFCLAISPAVKATRMTFPNVEIECIMDDISLAGSERDLAEATVHLVTGLSEIGLHINTSKSCVLNGAALAHHLGFQNLNGAKFLGAWIGNHDDARKFLDDQLERSKPFFSSVRLLRPELALPVMTRCGVPRANYAIRTHHPDASKHFAQAFDRMTLDTVSAILAVPTSQLLSSEDARTCVHLPLADGGLGITSMGIIHEIAYKASLSTIRGEDQVIKQDTLTKAENARLMQHNLSPEALAHIRWGRNASWIHSLQPNPHYRPAILQHIRGYTADVVACHCGAKMSKAELANHALGCSRIHGTNASARHREVKSAIIAFCLRNAIPVADEPVVYHDGVSSKRCDLRLTLPTEDVYVDVTVANAASKSHAGKSLSKIELLKSNEKDAKYLEHVQRLGGQLVTFVVEARGTLAPAAALLTKRLQSLAILRRTPAELKKDVQTAIARTNGAIITNVLRPLLVLA